METKITTINLRHLGQSNDSTVSALETSTGEHLCYIIEDGPRLVKVKHHTRIPAGTYEILARTDPGSRFLQRYSKSFSHRFVPHIIGVPGFTWILLHIGNSISDTSGCLLPNERYYKLGNDYIGKNSTDAYLDLYKYLDALFSNGHRVYIEAARGEVEKEPEASEVLLPEVSPTPIAVVEPEPPVIVAEPAKPTVDAPPEKKKPGCATAVFLLLALPFLVGLAFFLFMMVAAIGESLFQ